MHNTSTKIEIEQDVSNLETIHGNFKKKQCASAYITITTFRFCLNGRRQPTLWSFYRSGRMLKAKSLGIVAADLYWLGLSCNSMNSMKALKEITYTHRCIILVCYVLSITAHAHLNTLDIHKLNTCMENSLRNYTTVNNVN